MKLTPILSFSPGRRLSSLSSLLLALNFVAGCDDNEAEKPNDAEMEAGVDAWGIGGQGEAAPLYGESETAPEQLRLTLRNLGGPALGGGTDFAFLPDSRELLITLRGGALAHVALTDAGLVPLGQWDFEEELLPIKACGPTNVLLDPDFSENQFIYVTYCTDPFITRLVRYVWEPGAAPKDPAVIFESEIDEHEEDGEWHRFGSLGWEDEGVMWFLLGDHKQEHLSQDVTSPHAGLHRIVPNREPDGAGYEPASGNMTAIGDGPEPFESLYAYGLRSPWRGTRDSQGRYFVGDVGLVTYEEVNLVDDVGQNFGWDTHEGPCSSDCSGFVDPIASYSRSVDDPYVLDDPETVESELRAIWVGEIYESPRADRYHGLMNRVVAFGDLFTGWIRGLRVDAAGDVMMDESIGNQTNITQWRVGPDGYIYVLDLNGMLYVALLAD